MTSVPELAPEEAVDATSFARGLRLLLTIADRGEVRAEELGVALDMPTSSVYRYLRTLTDFGFVDRHEGRYRLGSRLRIGSGSRVTSEQLVRIADPILRMLAEETAETALVLRRIGLSAVCLHQIEGPQRLRVALEPGAMVPLYAGAGSRVLLAFAPPEVQAETLDGGVQAVTPGTLSDAVLRDGLAGIVRTGSATSQGELVSGSVSVAVPIVQDDGIVAALVVIGPEERCGIAWQSRTRRLLRSAAETT